jgi:hypothetical protein
MEDDKSLKSESETPTEEPPAPAEQPAPAQWGSGTLFLATLLAALLTAATAAVAAFLAVVFALTVLFGSLQFGELSAASIGVMIATVIIMVPLTLGLGVVYLRIVVDKLTEWRLSWGYAAMITASGMLTMLVVSALLFGLDLGAVGFFVGVSVAWALLRHRAIKTEVMPAEASADRGQPTSVESS